MKKLYISPVTTSHRIESSTIIATSPSYETPIGDLYDPSEPADAREEVAFIGGGSLWDDEW